VQSIIERIEKGQFWKFHGGIHPPEQKFLTTDKPIKKSHLPAELIIPVQQHIGMPGDLIVNVGDKVLKGQALTKTSLPMMVPIHAPTSGEIVNIKEHIIAHPSGLSELCVFIKPDGLETWRDKSVCEDYTKLSSQEIISKIADAGISGMGGAGFPTHIKVNTKANIEFLIINAVECEPYITADDLLIREHSEKIVEGIKILKQILSPQHVLIGIEDNKPEAIATLTAVTEKYTDMHVCALPTLYPSGGEKQLIKALTGKEVGSGTLPSSLGIVLQNVATCFAVAEAVMDDIPLIRRVVTVTGQALEKPQNIWSYIGTPVGELLNHFGYKPDIKDKRVIMGGPMMGFSLPSDHVPVVKFTNCILTPSVKEISLEQKEVECIRCGQCAEVCPSQLLPQEMQWSAKAKDYDQLHKLNLFDCIDCGACAYVCPSHIPLVHYYRIAKADIRQKELDEIKAEKAKTRFEARKARLERDKKEREEKQRLASEARKAAMNAKNAEGGDAKSAVAAALARVKAKKAQQATVAPENEKQAQVTDEKSQVSAAIARAKAKKLAQKNKSEENAVVQSSGEVSNKTAVNSPVEKTKSAAVAAAVAKAKAKKLAKQKEQQTEDGSKVIADAPEQATVHAEPESTATSSAKPKSAAVAAAVAKAKAKKLAKQKEQQTHEDNATDEHITEELIVTDNSVSQGSDEQDVKKAKVQAAIAKAKEKRKRAVEQEGSEENNVNTENNPDNDKKARIAAAVAKAKAKKQQRTESN